MKVRNGFVSNSSSSSFIVDGNKYTCVDVGISMINDYYDNMNINGYYSDKETEEYKKLYIDRLNNLENKNVGIFYQTGEDIEISKLGNKIYVNALNGIEWNIEKYEDYVEFDDETDEEIEEKTVWYFPQIDNKHFGRFPGYEEDWAKKKYGKFWFYRCEFEGCETQSRYIIKENHIFCPNCMRDPNGNKVSFRLEKLERIMEDEDI